MVLTNLLAGEEWRRREWTCEHSGEGEGGTDWESSRDISTLLLLSRFRRVQLCATPQMAAHQAPPSLGFSRQQYWVAISFSNAGK